jgi:hypothetical protein
MTAVARITRACVVALVGVAVIVPAATAAKPRVFHNCAAVNKVYAHGVARNFKVLKSADGFTARPFISTKLYLAQPRTLDRDHDGVACEK